MEEVNKIFPGADPFDIKPDERIKSNTGGYTKIEDGQTVKMRFTLNLYRYYKFQPENAIMPLMNRDARELLEQYTLDEIFEDQTIEVSEAYCSIIWNYDTDQAEVWQFSKTVLGQLQALNKDTDWEGGIEKNDIKVSRTGKKTDTRYSISYAKKSEEITDDMDQQMMNLDVTRMVASAVRL